MQIALPDFEQIIDSATLRARYLSALVLFSALATISSYFMWHYVGWSVVVQLLGIILIAVFGESIVSSQGYYQYPKKDLNGPFIRNVPIWIPFLWIFSIQTAFLTGLVFGLTGLQACLLSGLLAVIFDLTVLEPYLSRHVELWIWSPVEKGYFRFIPKELDRFTAPPGNYVVWLAFPILMNYGTILLSLLLS
jgi:hypothetical protein